MRSDIQTLRAVAVILVLLWHAGVPGVPGGYVGVDVFFVISGFLMTQILLSELVETGRLDLPAFYLRRARRLFPAAAAALAGTALITVVALPSTRWREVAGDLLASGVYLVNWRFAERSVDYLAADSAPSPVLHFWSLAVEEQFYLVWPVVLALAVILSARRPRGRLPRGYAAAAVVAGLVVAASLAWSVWLTAADPGRAYFVTTTRWWELALGAVVAALWPAWSTRPPRPVVAALLVVGGLVAVGLAAVLLDDGTAFPGVAALLPTAGTAAVLLGGPFLRTGGIVERLLDLRPALWVGGLSYSLYLWHWPLLVGAAAWVGASSLPWPVGLLVAAGSFLPAWLSLRYVESPFRGRVPRASPRVTGGRVIRWVGGYAGASLVCALAVVLAAQVLVPGGALVRSGSAAAAVVPAPEDAADDVYRPYYDDGCDLLSPGSEVSVCVGGDPDAEVTVALVGDSHAVMWMPALDAAGRDQGWRVELMAKTSCPAADVVPQLEKGPREVCARWLSEVLAELGARSPAAVMTAHVAIPPLHVDGEVVPSSESGPEFAAGLVRTWSALRGTGAEVVSMTPTPRFATSRPECVAQHREAVGECGAPVGTALDPVRAPVDAALVEAPWVHAVDLSELLCPGGTCPAVDDGVLVYSDTNHLTRTRVLQLAGPLGDALEPVLGDAGR